jgi:hypothetical protein
MKNKDFLNAFVPIIVEMKAADILLKQKNPSELISLFIVYKYIIAYEKEYHNKLNKLAAEKLKLPIAKINALSEQLIQLL